MDDVWYVNVDILIPREDAPTIDDAIDSLGDRLDPWFWVGHVNENSPSPGR